ncbi:MAG: 7-carboxy-7-deazaguanine synthase [Steroidobacteraceae bacterium]|nr:7-carboxy-7-deazaguanine synthase [Steroidobacteraceae bacterium]
MQGQAAATSSAPNAAAARLKITETFYSLQGEADAVGWPTFFIRLTGCPLRCQYCDTAYAFHGGEWRGLDALVYEALASGARHVCVNGGEPLAQKGCLMLLARLCDAGLQVSLETSGAIDASVVDSRVVRVIDVKTPGSGESQRNLDLDTQRLRSNDLLKFVICDRGDYEWSRELVRCRLDPGRPPAGQVSAPVAQGSVGRHAWPLNRRPPEWRLSYWSPVAWTLRQYWQSRASKVIAATRSASITASAIASNSRPLHRWRRCCHR